MKTRIISGIIMGLIVIAFLTLGMLVSSLFVTLFVAALSVVAVYEMLHNAAKIQSKATLVGACVYSFFGCVLASYGITEYITLSVFYALFAVVMTLKCHRDFDLSKILATLGMPIVLTFGFYCLEAVINNPKGLYYLLLMFNFSSICDMGAYFVGVTMGKHKLCPEISPKKTVEGAVGGILSAIVFTVVITLAFGLGEKLIAAILLTIPLCIVGMLGDLFASAIKRSVDLKDYGALIPGHGGILDRLDSMLLIAPTLLVLMSFEVI